MMIMSLRVLEKQSPVQEGCFAARARNDMVAKVNALREQTDVEISRA